MKIDVDNDKFYAIKELDKKFAISVDGNIYNIKTGKVQKRESGTVFNIIKLNGKTKRCNAAKFVAKYIIKDTQKNVYYYPRDCNYNNLSPENLIISRIKMKKTSKLLEKEDVRFVRKRSGHLLTRSGKLYRFYNDFWLIRCSTFKRLEYRGIYMDGQPFYLHRELGISFLAEKIPDNVLDLIQIRHIDRNKTNNDIDNLRIVVKSFSFSDSFGYTYRVSETKYSARCMWGDQKMHLGVFSSKAEAEEACTTFVRNKIKKLCREYI